MTDEYYIPDVKKPKDISNDVGKYTGALKDFIDSDDGSIKQLLLGSSNTSLWWGISE